MAHISWGQEVSYSITNSGECDLKAMCVYLLQQADHLSNVWYVPNLCVQLQQMNIHMCCCHSAGRWPVSYLTGHLWAQLHCFMYAVVDVNAQTQIIKEYSTYVGGFLCLLCVVFWISSLRICGLSEKTLLFCFSLNRLPGFFPEVGLCSLASPVFCRKDSKSKPCYFTSRGSFFLNLTS